MSFNRFSILFIIAATLLLSGCAGKKAAPPQKQLSAVDIANVSKALKADMPDCSHLSGVRIHTGFTTDLNNYTFLETRDGQNYHPRGRHIKYEDVYPYDNIHVNTLYTGNLAANFSTTVNHILSTQCRAVIVDSPSMADVTVSGHIKKFHSQVIDKVDTVDDGYNVNARTNEMNIGSILYVDSRINDEEWLYEELMTIQHMNRRDHDSTYMSALVGGSVEEAFQTDIRTYLHEEFLLSQYTQVTSIHRVEILLLHKTARTVKSNFKIYNDDDGSLIREFKEIDHSNRDSSRYRLFNQYRKLYTTGFGNLLYLINDYTKQVIERIPHDAL